MGVEAIKVTLLVPPENDVFEKVVFRGLSTRPVPPSASPDTDARKVCFWPIVTLRPDPNQGDHSGTPLTACTTRIAQRGLAPSASSNSHFFNNG